MPRRQHWIVVAVDAGIAKIVEQERLCLFNSVRSVANNADRQVLSVDGGSQAG